MGSIGVFPEKIPTFNPNQELHVLAVDDSIVDRKVIERLLKISSCKVTTVDSGRRALQYLGLDGGAEKSSVGFEALKVNMIITDYWMPGMTGYELLKKIKESSTFKEIPVVIMSSENVLPRINRCLEEGAEEFLVKPVQLSDVKRLKNHLTREEVVGDELRGTTITNNKRKLQAEIDNTTTTTTATTTTTTTTATTCSSSIESPSRRHRLASEISDLSEIF